MDLRAALAVRRAAAGAGKGRGEVRRGEGERVVAAGRGRRWFGAGLAGAHGRTHARPSSLARAGGRPR